MKAKFKLFLAPLALAIALTGSANAAVLLSDNFESYTTSTAVPIGAAIDGFKWQASGKATVVNTGSPFGATNKYVDYNDTDGGTSVLRSQSHAEASNTLTTFSFDFYEPTVASGTAVFVGYGIDNLDTTSLNRRVGIQLGEGAIGGVTGGTGTTYSQDKAYTLYMIYNDTASTANYLGGSIASETAHVWFKDLTTNAVTFAGVANGANLGTTESAYTVGLRSNSGAHFQRLYLDNISFVEGAAAIPEPGSAMLLGSLGVFLLLRRRR